MSSLKQIYLILLLLLLVIYSPIFINCFDNNNKNTKLGEALRNNTSLFKNSNSSSRNKDGNEKGDQGKDENILKTEAKKLLTDCGFDDSNSNDDNSFYDNNNDRDKWMKSDGNRQKVNEYDNRKFNNHQGIRYNTKSYDQAISQEGGDNEERIHNRNNFYNNHGNYHHSSNYAERNRNYGSNSNRNNNDSNESNGNNNNSGYDYRKTDRQANQNSDRPHCYGNDRNNRDDRNYQITRAGNDYFPDNKRRYDGNSGYNQNYDQNGNIYPYNPNIRNVMGSSRNLEYYRNRRSSRSEDNLDDNSQCISQCIFGYLDVLDDSKVPSETLLIKWLQDHLSNDLKRIRALREARRCFARLSTTDLEDGCEFSKSLSKCLNLELE